MFGPKLSDLTAHWERMDRMNAINLKTESDGVRQQRDELIHALRRIAEFGCNHTWQRFTDQKVSTCLEVKRYAEAGLGRFTDEARLKYASGSHLCAVCIAVETLEGIALLESNIRGEPVRLGELEPGMLFEFDGTIALKSEYRTNKGAIEAFIVGSGEFFWGGTSNAEDQGNLIVTPVSLNERG